MAMVELVAAPPPEATPGDEGAGSSARDRAGAALAAVAAVVGVVLAGWHGLEASGAPAPDVGGPTRAHLVQPGETYWSIASALHPDGDVRATVDHLVSANGGRPLQAGDELRVPR